MSEKSISKTQAFGLLTSALRLQGYAVVTGDGYAKVVPEADAKLQSVPTQVGNGASQVKGDQIATQVFYLNYESAANLVAVLRPLISPNNTINANPGNNSAGDHRLRGQPQAPGEDHRRARRAGRRPTST